MPLVNVYGSERARQAVLKVTADLKTYVAEKLSVSERKLSSDEISIRIIASLEGGMISELELDISAHAYAPRVERQDEICREVAAFVREKTGIQNAQVWLTLSNLGHTM